jgi:hypothetical protein
MAAKFNFVIEEHKNEWKRERSHRKSEIIQLDESGDNFPKKSRDYNKFKFPFIPKPTDEPLCDAHERGK